MVNKLDQIPEASRDAAVERIEMRVRERNPDVHVVGAIGARIDPTLLYDVSDADERGRCRSGNCSSMPSSDPHSDDHDHVHAVSVTATSDGCIDPGVLIDLLEEPPAGVYRLKGTVAVRYRARVRTYTVNVVGSSVHVATAPTDAPPIAWWRSAPASTSTTFAPARTPLCVRTTGRCPPRASAACSGTGGSASRTLPADRLGAMEGTR